MAFCIFALGLIIRYCKTMKPMLKYRGGKYKENAKDETELN